MNNTAVDRPYQAERTAEQTPTVSGRGTYYAVLFFKRMTLKLIIVN